LSEGEDDLNYGSVSRAVRDLLQVFGADRVPESGAAPSPNHESFAAALEVLAFLNGAQLPEAMPDDVRLRLPNVAAVLTAPGAKTEYATLVFAFAAIAWGAEKTGIPLLEVHREIERALLRPDG
jgi:hypothetical protein